MESDRRRACAGARGRVKVETIQTVTVIHMLADNVRFDVHFSSGRTVEVEYDPSVFFDPRIGVLADICESVGVCYLEDTDELIGRRVLSHAERQAFLFEQGMLLPVGGAQ